MNGTIPVMLLVDIEPDKHMIPRDQKLPWEGFELCAEFYGKLRLEVQSLTGKPAHFGWYCRIDPQIETVYGNPAWGMAHYRRLLDQFLDAGDEIGLHPHAYRWQDEHKNWLIDHANQEWVSYCVEMGFDFFRKTMGRNCESFRFGERWMNTETMNLIGGLGARYDLTLEPFQMPIISYKPEEASAHTGLLPDGRKFLRSPYKPSREDFSKADPSRKDAPWVVPLSAGNYFYEMGKLERTVKTLIHSGDLMPRPFTLTPGINPKIFKLILNECLENVRPAYLTISIRTDIPQDAKRGSWMVENFNYLKSHPQIKHFQFTTVQEAVQLLGYDGKVLQTQS